MRRSIIMTLSLLLLLCVSVETRAQEGDITRLGYISDKGFNPKEMKLKSKTTLQEQYYTNRFGCYLRDVGDKTYITTLLTIPGNRTIAHFKKEMLDITVDGKPVKCERIEGYGDTLDVIFVDSRAQQLALTGVYPRFSPDAKEIRSSYFSKPGHFGNPLLVADIRMKEHKMVRSRKPVVYAEGYDELPTFTAPKMLKKYDKRHYHPDSVETWTDYTGDHLIDEPMGKDFGGGRHMKLYRTKDATYVVVSCRQNFPRNYYVVDTNAILVDRRTGDFYPMIRVEHYNDNRVFWVWGEVGKYEPFVYVFPPLKSDVEEIDLFEGPTDFHRQPAPANLFERINVNDFRNAKPYRIVEETTTEYLDGEMWEILNSYQKKDKLMMERERQSMYY